VFNIHSEGWFEASPVKCYCIRRFPIGEVSELADEHDLGSCAERRGADYSGDIIPIHSRPDWYGVPGIS